MADELVTVYWPGKSTVACPAHLNKLKGLASFMGFALNYATAPEGVTCDNCRNEATKHASE